MIAYVVVLCGGLVFGIWLKGNVALLLALDTATATASVAAFDEEQGRLLAETTWQTRRRHTQDLMALVQRTLLQAGVEISDVSALAVTTGPGSFTGVRVGVSAVKGLALGLPQTPSVVGLPTLCVTAAPWVSALTAAAPSSAVCAYIQAGRGRYNWAWFRRGDLLLRPGRGDHCAGSADEFVSALAGHEDGMVWLAGEADEALLEATSGLAHVHGIDQISAMRRAGHLARLAALHLAAGASDELESLQPLYLRNP